MHAVCEKMTRNGPKIVTLKYGSNFIASDVTTNPSWRNWLARSTVNRKVGGSSPPEGDHTFS